MKLPLALVSVILITGLGCQQAGNVPPAREPDYSIGFYNTTGQTLNAVHVEWVVNGYRWLASCGILTSGGGGGAEDDSQPDPIPRSVTVFWTTPDGVKRQRNALVASKVKDLKNFTGTIWFKFTSLNEFQVIPMTDAEKDRLGHQKKPIIP